MRKEFSAAIERIAKDNDRIVFITGDLGFNALENLQEVMGPRFINAGVAEQNMVGVAAGMAYKGYKVFCYSIAPFAVYRCLEQFRNDVCLHNLPVFMVGNGGGYGYGIMGSTHHAIEDLACLSGLQNVKTWIPAFSDEIDPMVDAIVAEGRPAYLRLGAGPKTPEGSQSIGSFRRIVSSDRPKGTVLALGPVAANVLKALQSPDGPETEFDVFTAGNLPLELPAELVRHLEQTPNLLVVEEHVGVGGLAQQLSVKLLEHGLSFRKFVSLSAQGYPDGRYGDQSYHQQQSGLDADHIRQQLASFIA